MVSITLSVSNETRELMKKFPEINWSAIVRKAITEKAKKLELKEELLKDLEKESSFIDWSIELGKKAKKGRISKIK